MSITFKRDVSFEGSAIAKEPNTSAGYGTDKKEIDLNDIEKGIYFIILEQ